MNPIVIPLILRGIFIAPAKLSFSGAVAYHYCVILSEVAKGNEVEESSAYPISIPERSFDSAAKRLHSG